MDLPEFPYKMPILNRLFVDAHYLVGLQWFLRGFDIAHSAETYYSYTQQCLHAKKLGLVKKVVVTVLENIPFNNEGILGRKGFKKRTRTEADHLIALTKKTKAALVREGADSRKITVIGHGIDTNVFQPRADHWKFLADQKKKELVVLFSGRLEAYKGVFDILDAAKIMSQKNMLSQPIRFLFVGEGSAHKDMVCQEHEYGLDHIVEHKAVSYDQMPELYKHADIMVAPSITTKTWAEQYCTALLEGQSMGLPIVTTSSGGIPENVGTAALFCKEGDGKSLAQTIEQFVKSPGLRARYGRMARERALRVHDSRLIADKLDGVYKSLFL